jgi:uncharacterized membrane protein YagU involved in acid resistance
MKARLVWGAIGGALGGLAMKAMVKLVDPRSFGLSSKTDAKTAHELWRRTGWRALSEEEAEYIGAAMHYGFAIGAGAAYSAAQGRFPLLRIGGGTAFGGFLWLFGDEVAVTLAGLENPRKTSLFSHVSAFGAHLVYGLVLEVLLNEMGTRLKSGSNATNRSRNALRYSAAGRRVVAGDRGSG